MLSRVTRRIRAVFGRCVWHCTLGTPFHVLHHDWVPMVCVGKQLFRFVLPSVVLRAAFLTPVPASRLVVRKGLGSDIKPLTSGREIGASATAGGIAGMIGGLIRKFVVLPSRLDTVFTMTQVARATLCQGFWYLVSLVPAGKQSGIRLSQGSIHRSPKVSGPHFLNTALSPDSQTRTTRKS